jgi:hypothetical protein
MCEMLRASWVLWLTPGIPALRKLRQKDLEFEDSMSYIARPYLKKQCEMLGMVPSR